MNRNNFKQHSTNNYNSIQQQNNNGIYGNQMVNNNLHLNSNNPYHNNQSFNIKKNNKNANRSLTIDHQTSYNSNHQQQYLTINPKRGGQNLKINEKDRSESMQDSRKKRPISQQQTHQQNNNQLFILNPYQQAFQKQKQYKKMYPEKKSQTIDHEQKNYSGVYSQNQRKNLRKNTENGNNYENHLNYLTIQPYQQYNDSNINKQSQSSNKNNKYNNNSTSNSGGQIFTIKKNNNFNYMKEEDKDERIKTLYSKQNTHASYSQNPRSYLLNPQQHARNAKSSQDNYVHRNTNSSFENYLDLKDKKKNTLLNSNNKGKVTSQKNSTIYSLYGQQKQNQKNLNNINVSLLKNGNQKLNTEGNDILKQNSNHQKQKQWSNIINTEGNTSNSNKNQNNTRQNNFLQEQQKTNSVKNQNQVSANQAQKNVQTINNLLKTIQSQPKNNNNTNLASNGGQKQNIKNNQLNLLQKNKKDVYNRSKSQNTKKNKDSDTDSKLSRGRSMSKNSKELNNNSKDEMDSVLSKQLQKKREKVNQSMIELNQNQEENELKNTINSQQLNKRSIQQQPDTEIKTYIALQTDYRTKQGKLASNPNKVNQDTQMMTLNINNTNNTHFFAVCDGHGSVGHHVSGFVKQFLPLILLNDTKLIFENPKQALFNGFAIVNHQLMKTESIDCAFSGTTLVSVLMMENTLYCANAGDSRAVVGFINQKGQWQNKDISRDHKPSIDFEAERIIKSGGRIDTFRDKDGNQLGPLRVWLKNENIPGLAMSRSVGDNVATSVGVTWEPEIFEFSIQKTDNFLILASDGVWEFLDSIEVVQMVAKFYEKKDLKGACDAVLEESYARWTKDDDSVIDDITLQIIFFERKPVEDLQNKDDLVIIEDY